jgi:hypothetical protein
MDEARSLFRRLGRRPRCRGQKGQAMVEYLLLLILSLGFLRFVYFNKDFGFKAMLDKSMLRLGAYLEENLKSGTKPGADGEKSMDAFAGTSRWTN